MGTGEYLVRGRALWIAAVIAAALLTLMLAGSSAARATGGSELEVLTAHKHDKRHKHAKPSPKVTIRVKSGADHCRLRVRVKRAPRGSRVQVRSRTGKHWRTELNERVGKGNSRIGFRCSRIEDPGASGQWTVQALLKRGHRTLDRSKTVEPPDGSAPGEPGGPPAGGEPPGSTLAGGGALRIGDRLVSPNGEYRLVMQGDRNLVLYGPGGALWNRAGGSRAVMQGDGNFVLYDGGTAKWSTGTAGNAGAFLIVQTDGNLVVYSKQSKPLWTRHEVQGPVSIRNATIADRAETRPNLVHGGQCLEFVSDVIVEAGGPRYWFGLDTSTYQAQWQQRATRVATLSEAKRGDIIQWGGGAGGNLLHTAIVTAPGSDPALIDSNFSQTNDELVRRGRFSSRHRPGAVYRIWRVGKL